MGVQSGNGKSSQISLLEVPVQGRLNAEGKKIIIDAFLKEQENQISNLVKLTGYSRHQVSRTIDDYYKNKKPSLKKKNFIVSKWNDPILVTKELEKDIVTKRKYGNADVEYYVEAVLTFSEKNEKQLRTDRGWISTIRQFMNSDKAANKFRKRQFKEQNLRQSKHVNF